MTRFTKVFHGVLDRTADHMRGGITQAAIVPSRTPYAAYDAAVPKHFDVHAGRAHRAEAFHDDLSPRELMAALRAS